MNRSTLDSPARRSLLAAVAAGSTGLVAGCLGDGGQDEPEENGGDASDPPAFPDHPVDEPMDPPEGRRCDGPCGMEPADYPETNAQIAHAEGEGVFFDSVGCLVSYLHDPTFYGGPDSAVEAVWVRDFGTTEPLDATEAAFVLDYSKDRHEEVMAHNPKPFADRADAVEYVDSYADLGEEDIVDLDAFGAEQAHRYRDYPIEDS